MQDGDVYVVTPLEYEHLEGSDCVFLSLDSVVLEWVQ